MYSPTPNDSTQKVLQMKLFISATNGFHCVNIVVEFRNTHLLKNEMGGLNALLIERVTKQNQILQLC